jgi:hypothetical protein
MNSDLQSPQVLCRTANEAEAAVIVAALAEKGVLAMAVGGFTAGFIAEAPGDVSIMVSQGDLPVAQKALHEFRQSEQSVDWSKVDVGEPEDE